jgi:succinoglycan biosynthesis transport protein ExoP
VLPGRRSRPMSKNFELMHEIEVEDYARPEVRARVHRGAEASGHKNGRLLPLDEVAREEALKLVQRVFMLHTDSAPRVVVFAGISRGNGCSRICSAAARTLADNAAGSICLVDGDLRSPSLAESFRIPNHHGLTDSLREQGPIQTFAERLGPDNLWLISAGSPSDESSRLLNSSRVRVRFEELRSAFDYVLVDAPPLSHFADAVTFGQLSDGLVLILEANATRREAALAVTENLRASQIRVLGAVLNKRTFPIPDSLYRRV